MAVNEIPTPGASREEGTMGGAGSAVAESPRRRRSSFGWSRRALARLNLAAIVFLSFYILVVFVSIIYFHPVRIDLTDERLHTLSDATKQRLDLVDTEIRVIIPLLFQEGSALTKIEMEVFGRARTLLDEYVAYNPLIKITDELNLQSFSDAERWKELQEEYRFAPHQINRFLFVAGAEGEYRQQVMLDDLAVYDRPASPFEPTPPKIHSFRGEEVFTSAITRLIRRERKKLYFTRDSKEPSLEDESPGGLVLLQRELEANGFEVAPLSLAAERQVPQDCDLLVIVNPTGRVADEDLDIIEAYLQGDGRLLVTLGSTTSGVERLLADWGIEIPAGVVRQAREMEGQLLGWDNQVLASSLNPLHPITQEFDRRSFQVLAVRARPLSPVGRDDFSSEYLIKTADEPRTGIERNGRIDDDTIGPVILAATVSRPVPANPPPGYEHSHTRVAAFGTSSLVSNRYLYHLSHRDLLLNTIHWLLGQEEELTAGTGTPWQARQIKWSPAIQRFLFWVPIFVFPGLVLCVGSFVYLLRRS